ncbi:MAG: hypothetical protein ABIY55_33310 [Kofleriaceae bacterium]
MLRDHRDRTRALRLLDVDPLAAHWGVDVRWFDGGHLAQIGRGDAIREVRRELGQLALPGRVPRMPAIPTPGTAAR